MQRRRLADTDWSYRPLVPPGLAMFSAFAILGIGLLLVNQAEFDEGIQTGLHIALYLGAFMAATGVIAMSRASAKMRSLGRMTCEDGGLRIGRHLIPYRSIRTIRFTHPEIAEEAETVDTEIEIHVFRRFFPLRFVALDTAVDDLLMGLARVDKENPDALVAPTCLAR